MHATQKDYRQNVTSDRAAARAVRARDARADARAVAREIRTYKGGAR